MASTQTSVTFVLENGKHRRWHSDHVCLAGANPGFEICQSAPSKRQLKCSIYNLNLMADAYMESQSALTTAREENEALKARIRALEATAAETEALVADLLPSGAWTSTSASPPAGEPEREASPAGSFSPYRMSPKTKATQFAEREASQRIPRRQDAPEFAPTVARLFRVGRRGRALFNQDGWLFDEESHECIGFWNGNVLVTFDDEDTDDEI